MNIRKTALILVFLGLTIAPITTLAAETDSRYFVKTTSQIWKKSFGVRQNLDNGFSANLGAAQFRLAKMFNIQIEPVGRFYILNKNDEKESQVTPSSSITWGASRMIGNTVTVDKEAGRGVVVAVLDTGVFKDHSDLKNRIIDCADFTSKSSVVEGECEDKNGHGTHVAGVIAADGGENGKGIFGFAPSANILAYKVCDDTGLCFGDDIAAGIERAITKNANIINIGFGADTNHSIVKSAIDRAISKGILVIAAAGNDGPYAGSIDFPASMSSVISVGSIDSNDRVVEWSSRGDNDNSRRNLVEERDLEFVAPGSGVESTWNDGGYVTLSGTSMSAPHISGLAAKLWQVEGQKQAISVRSALQKLSKDLGRLGEDPDSGFGLPNLIQ